MKREICTNKDALLLAAERLLADDLVILPTETVYGLAANAKSDVGIAKIYEAKGRPSNNPLIIHVANFQMARQYGQFCQLASDLAAAFWPGPLTIIVPFIENGIAKGVLAGNKTIAIRNPKGPIAKLSAMIDSPIAAPSANLSGRISATNLDDIADDFEGKVALALEGDTIEIGIESTIVLVEGADIRILRPGSISKSDLQKACPNSNVLFGPKSSSEKNHQEDALLAPGMMSSHYAPRAKIRLDAKASTLDEAFLAFGPIPDKVASRHIFQLSTNQNLAEAAQNLYAGLHQLDRTGVQTIAISPIPSSQIGLAILDRLMRAAAPREC